MSSPPNSTYLQLPSPHTFQAVDPKTIWGTFLALLLKPDTTSDSGLANISESKGPSLLECLWGCCSVTKSCDPMDCSMTGFPVLHYLPEFALTHVHWVSDAIQPSHPLSPPSPLVLSLSQHQGLFQWVGFLYQVAKVSELQSEHQSFQWIFRADFL